MKAVPRSRRLVALLALPLALWSAAPTIRWCWIAWSGFPGCVADCADANARPCGPGDGRCPLDDPACAAKCGADSSCPTDRSDSRDRTRVFCIGGPVGGVGVKPSLGGGSPEPALALAGAFEELAPPQRAERVHAPVRARWPTTPRAMRPPVRAPPLV